MTSGVSMRFFSSQRKEGYFQDLVDNIKQGFGKNKAMYFFETNALKKFQKEANSFFYTNNSVHSS